ncbi:MAG: biopolymer transporter ExbD [Verrucomicrobiota bacterium]|nr:biopolymer transporter ExbD [Verrucomicrobiota bacterium]
MLSRNRNKGRKTLKEIDVTPLVDLTFILLIVFMITAPILEYSIDVTPPELNAEEIKENKVVVTLGEDGNIYVDDKQMFSQELTDYLFKINPQSSVFIRADESRAYGEVIALMRTIKEAGIKKVSLITRKQI